MFIDAQRPPIPSQPIYGRQNIALFRAPRDFDLCVIYKHCAALRLKIDFVDALIVAMAERLNITRLLTFDRRDFQLLRPKHCVSFELLPQSNTVWQTFKS
jgi:hypothetical protein